VRRAVAYVRGSQHCQKLPSVKCQIRGILTRFDRPGSFTTPGCQLQHSLEASSVRREVRTLTRAIVTFSPQDRRTALQLLGNIAPLEGYCLRVLVVAPGDTVSGSKRLGMMIEIAWQVYDWYQKNAVARGMLKKCPAQLGLGKVSSVDLPRTKAVPGKLGWERCSGAGGLGRKLSQACRAQTEVVWGGNHPSP
jgi:hypothetical protein